MITLPDNNINGDTIKVLICSNKTVDMYAMRLPSKIIDTIVEVRWNSYHWIFKDNTGFSLILDSIDVAEVYTKITHPEFWL